METVYFFWVIRDAGAVKWFEHLLLELERDTTLDVKLNIHVYITGRLTSDQQDKVKEAFQSNKLTTGLMSAQAAPSPRPQVHRSSSRKRSVRDDTKPPQMTENDPITNLKSPAFYGRPMWDAILTDIAKKHIGACVGVFYCGNTPGKHSLKKACQQQTKRQQTQSKDRITHFTFHRETF